MCDDEANEQVGVHRIAIRSLNEFGDNSTEQGSTEEPTR